MVGRNAPFRRNFSAGLIAPVCAGCGVQHCEGCTLKDMLGTALQGATLIEVANVAMNTVFKQTSG
jgi:hypothetical protein